MKKYIRTINIVLLTVFVFSNLAYAGAATDIVETHVNKVLDILRDPELKGETSKKAKEQKIRLSLDNLIDPAELSKRTLARNWQKFSIDQQKEFESLFVKLLGNVYIDRILTYSGEKVVFMKEIKLTEKTAEVQSKIVTKTNEIPIHYRLTLKNDKWKVYDILIEGVSLVKNYRSQFDEILAKNSPQHLLEILRKKVDPTFGKTAGRGFRESKKPALAVWLPE